MRALLLFAAGLAIAVPASRAQEASTTTTAVAPTSTTTQFFAAEEPEELDLSLTSPRSAMQGFLVASRAGDYEKAVDYLDVRHLPKSRRETRAPLLARQLRTVLDRALWLDIEQVSEAPDGNRDDGMPPRREVVGTIKTSKAPISVMLERVPLPDGTLGWKIASSVVALIPDLYREFGDGPFADRLPDFLLDITILELRLWQWLGVAALLALGALLGWLTTAPLLRLLGFVVPEDRRHQSQRLLRRLKAPLRLLVALVVLTGGLPFLALGIRAAAWLTLIRKTATTLAFTWLWLRVVDVVAALADDRLRIHGRAGAVGIVPLLRRSVKIFVAVIAVILVVQNIGYDATGLLAGLGVGGLALALAAQKTVENLFGGVMLVADQPVRVGDLCRFGTRVGTVEYIGLRSTRLRTAERSVVTIPNAEFSAGQIENLAARDRMLLQATFGLQLSTPTADLRRLLADLRAVLERAPRVDAPSVGVRLVGFGATTTDVEVVAYIQTRDWNEFVTIRENVFLEMLDVLGRAGATPTPRKPTEPPTPTA
jgi:MscS family membrane protein